jgi:prepilin-type N-terminal cleavage/methylation domain-containing protein
MKKYLSVARGFTLIELLVTIAIIALLSTLSIAAFDFARKKAMRTVAEADIATIEKAIATLVNSSNLWPGGQPINTVCDSIIPAVNCAIENICGADDGCDASLASSTSGIIDTDGSFSNWDGPYMQSMPSDPWGHEYFFNTNYEVDINGNPCGGCGFFVVAIGSNGSDGIVNNTDDIFKVIYK